MKHESISVYRKVTKLFNFPIKELVYTSSAEYGELKMYVFEPPACDELRPAILFFHGAGFSAGKARPEQFQHHAHYFSALGFVSICVEYRPRHVEGLFSPVTGIKHAKTAVRQVRAQSALLGIDPCRIFVAGASAGGYLALCTAMIETVTDLPDDLSGDLSVSSVPDVLIIFNGGVDTAVLIEMFPELSVDLAGASPKDHVRGFLPPSLFFHGTQDENIPYATVEEFVDAMWKSGNDSRLVRFEGLDRLN
ncbi:hypothetical protein BSK56_15530 [Paenibacillus borealis]|uniref:BD-FAE-like domain-containing protein n=1 Tax=Paenibacillus borealis TaxID=160799 RepID=A0ABX3H8V6_PAEBO|nr:alpha/beta hydrolase [Paenibacillus borealis]OMD46898.1 hypothetical protein BSK56_15530 [Paenibacillus borealis]